MASKRRCRLTSLQFLLLVPALLTSGLAAFLSGSLAAEAPAGDHVRLISSLLVCGVSALVWSAPAAMKAWRRSSRHAWSVYWRLVAKAGAIRFLAGLSVAVGLIFLLPFREVTFWPVVVAVVCLAVAVELWRIGGTVLTESPREGKNAVRRARLFLRRWAAKKKD